MGLREGWRHGAAQDQCCCRLHFLAAAAYPATPSVPSASCAGQVAPIRSQRKYQPIKRETEEGSPMKRSITVILLVALAGLLPLVAQAKASPLGSVRFIRHGLSVQSPHHKASHAKVKQKLYSAYHLATTRSQLASLSFRDGSILHMNQNTDLTLRTSHVTNVKQGEVDVIDNGGHHQVVTAVATLSAIGTQYDVRVIVGKGGKVTMIVTVVSGQVMVTTSQGTQQVNAGDQVMVSSSGTISQPVPVDAASVVTWTSVLPAPPASSSPTPTPTASATAAAATPTPTATSLPTPTATPTSTPAPLFSYSFGGLTASWTIP